jgi:hypothetical protein
MPDYRLMLTKGTKDRPDLSLERADPSGTALARTSSNSKLQTRPLVTDGVQNNKPQLSKRKSQGEKKLVAVPRWAPETKTDWPTDCRS